MPDWDAEARRLFEDETVRPTGTIDEISFSSPDPAVTLQKVIEVLRIVRSHDESWPPTSVWRLLLPSWFVDACAPEPTEEERAARQARWRAMTWKQKQRETKSDSPWTLEGWPGWFECPATDLDRGWAWANGEPTSQDTGVVRIEVDGDPYPYGTLRWLLQAAGANDVRRSL